jgi:hypothetical protein
MTTKLELLAFLASYAEVLTILAAMKLYQKHHWYAWGFGYAAILVSGLDAHYLWGNHTLLGLLR